MQYTALIIAAIGTSTVYAADCYPSSGSQTCLATDDVWALRQVRTIALSLTLEVPITDTLPGCLWRQWR